MFIPLAYNGAFAGDVTDYIHLATQFAGSVISAAGGAMAPFISVGKGIGSIFILFVIFSFATHILNGGKFEAKMLWPVVVYVCVSFFGIISNTTIAFTGMINKQCVAAASNANRSVLDGMTLYDYVRHQTKKKEKPEEAKMRKKVTAKCLVRAGFPEDEVKRALNLADEISGADPDYSDDAAGTDEAKTGIKILGSIKGLGEQIRENLEIAWESYMVRLDASLVMGNSKDEAKEAGLESAIVIYDQAYFLEKNGIPWILAIIMQWIVIIMTNVYIIMGAVLTGVFIAFGPVIWAFAVFPGNQKVIGSWFIRLVQFSLYAPICALTTAFSNRLIVTCMAASSEAAMGSVLLLLCGLFASLALVCSTPSLATMIIEGASGGISLMAGVSAASSAIKTMASFRDMFHDKRDERKQDRQNDLLGQILERMPGGNNQSSGNGGNSNSPHGQNPKSQTTPKKP